MSAEVFSEAMGMIGEKYIMEAATYQRKKHTAPKVWLSRVAGVILAILLQAAPFLLSARKPEPLSLAGCGSSTKTSMCTSLLAML